MMSLLKSLIPTLNSKNTPNNEAEDKYTKIVITPKTLTAKDILRKEEEEFCNKYGIVQDIDYEML